MILRISNFAKFSKNGAKRHVSKMYYQHLQNFQSFEVIRRFCKLDPRSISQLFLPIFGALKGSQVLKFVISDLESFIWTGQSFLFINQSKFWVFICLFVIKLWDHCWNFTIEQRKLCRLDLVYVAVVLYICFKDTKFQAFKM